MDVVADKTGYPAEMLGLQMELESDLGVDSIKRVEILSAMLERSRRCPTSDTEAAGRAGARSARLVELTDIVAPQPRRRRDRRRTSRWRPPRRRCSAAEPRAAPRRANRPVGWAPRRSASRTAVARLRRRPRGSGRGLVELLPLTASTPRSGRRRRHDPATDGRDLPRRPATSRHDRRRVDVQPRGVPRSPRVGRFGSRSSSRSRTSAARSAWAVVPTPAGVDRRVCTALVRTAAIEWPGTTVKAIDIEVNGARRDGRSDHARTSS